MSRRYCLALDLKDDPDLIAEYERHHERIWPEIARGIRDAGIEAMEIYRVGSRLFMVMEVSATFSFQAKAAADRDDARVQEWEDLMWRYQQALPMAAPGEKWMLMDQIFSLEEQE